MHGIGAVRDGAKADAEARPSPRLVRASHEFEAQMLKELMKPLTRSEEGNDESDKGGPLAEFASEVFGQALSRAGGFGIADRIITSLSRNDPDGRPVP